MTEKMTSERQQGKQEAGLPKEESLTREEAIKLVAGLTEEQKVLLNKVLALFI